MNFAMKMPDGSRRIVDTKEVLITPVVGNPDLYNLRIGAIVALKDMPEDAAETLYVGISKAVNAFDINTLQQVPDLTLPAALKESIASGRVKAEPSARRTRSKKV